MKNCKYCKWYKESWNPVECTGVFTEEEYEKEEDVKHFNDNGINCTAYEFDFSKGFKK